MNKVIKRNGQEVDFSSEKIRKAIEGANKEVDEKDRISQPSLDEIVREIVDKCAQFPHALSVEDIQNLVEEEIMDGGYFDVARHYIKYRYNRELARKSNSTDETILSLINSTNEEIKQENSNKNPVINSTQRDYTAGEVSKDISRRILLPKDVIDAHDTGIIHFHDMDYFMTREYNCCLINLEDMLQNGTVISGTGIDKPHSFRTACNVATQIVAQVASNQYGGQTFTLTHLAPFVRISEDKIRNQILSECEETKVSLTQEQIDELVKIRLKREIAEGVQTIQYQVNTLMTTNGQAPFVSVMMYLNEDPEYKKEVAMIIEEVLKQRIIGTKNEKGVYITPTFPKLLYVLEEDNIHEDDPYFYLTKLAAKCTAKRMVPDYISEKKMKEYKLSKGETEGNGDVYPCMGCRSFLTPDRSGNGFNNVSRAKNYDGKPKYYGRLTAC